MQCDLILRLIKIVRGQQITKPVNYIKKGDLTNNYFADHGHKHENLTINTNEKVRHLNKHSTTIDELSRY